MKSLASAALASLALAACATAPDPGPGDIDDPYEGFNRKMFAFNNGVDRYALGPAADVYETVTPAFARDRVSDFLSNLNGPVIFANDILQAEPSRAGTTVTRFGINTTVGLLGLWDAADYFGIEGHSEDFGQTLCVDHRFHRGVSQESLEFGTKEESAAPLGIEEGLDAQPVPGKKQALIPLAPDAKGKNAVEALNAGRTPLHVSHQKHFSVTGTAERVAPSLQLSP